MALIGALAGRLTSLSRSLPLLCGTGKVEKKRFRLALLLLLSCFALHSSFRFETRCSALFPLFRWPASSPPAQLGRGESKLHVGTFFFFFFFLLFAGPTQPTVIDTWRSPRGGG